MTISITTSKKEQIFNKDVINIGTNKNCDIVMNLDFELLISIHQNDSKVTIINNFNSNKILFKGQTINKMDVDKICVLMLSNSDEFIKIEVLENTIQKTKTVSSISNEELNEDDMKKLYGKDVNAVTKIKIEKQKEDIEKERVGIIKQVSFMINDLKSKISSNHKTNIFLHIAMFFSAMICAFGVSNYLMGLSIQESANYLHLPTNIKVWLLYSVIIYGICLLLKQGIYLYLYSGIQKEMSKSAKLGQSFMIVFSLIFILGIYIVNLIYFMNLNDFMTFAIFISFFFSGIMSVLAISCGYFKCNGAEWAASLNKYEYREDFESVIKSYRQWVERYINNLSNTKIQYIKDKLFNLQLKSIGEIIIGMLTAPFLAYGVSNTLATCFPEAAGWVRISGLRISPVFLVLSTFLIIFAFFAFVNAFLCTKKIQASQVIKLDGFSDYQHHGVTIYGLEGVRKLNAEKNRSMIIACTIIFIEFTMNISYFMTEIGGDLQGMFLSLVAALVPTALLIAETYMLSQTKFDIYASDELLSKIDKD
ncbi:MAG: hypothetical protein R3Y28_07650 [Candidatus Gastranaerophilales bacterium]